MATKITGVGLKGSKAGHYFMGDKMEDKIRQFDSGATRDTVEGKLSYIKALSPIVLQRYVKYIGKHRTQSDGSQRDWDNWKQGIPQDVYLDGLGRHEMAVWLLCHGFPAFDNHGPVTLEDSLCGIIFNTQGMLHELLIEQQYEKEFVYPEGWVIEQIDTCGWRINAKTLQDNNFLWKDFTMHQNSTGWLDFDIKYERDAKYGEAPGYWPTEANAKVALQQYLEKEKL